MATIRLVRLTIATADNELFTLIGLFRGAADLNRPTFRLNRLEEIYSIALSHNRRVSMFASRVLNGF